MPPTTASVNAESVVCHVDALELEEPAREVLPQDVFDFHACVGTDELAREPCLRGRMHLRRVPDGISTERA